MNSFVIIRVMPWIFLIAFSQKIHSAAAFLSAEKGGSARAIGLGSTFVGIAEGSAALMWNPAGLSSLMRREIGLHYNTAMAGSIRQIAMFGLPLGYKNGLGLSLGYENNGGTLDVGGGWGRALSAGFSMGLGFKTGSDSNSFVGDAGILWSLAPELSAGVAYSNLGPAAEGHKRAQRLRLGVSSVIEKGTWNQWLFAVAGEFLIDGGQSIHLGIENLLYETLALRAGYAFSVFQSPTGDMQGWTLGLGILLNRILLDQFSLDYAFVPLDELGNLQRLSLTYAFGEYSPSPFVRPEVVAVFEDADFTRVPGGGGAEQLSIEAEGRLKNALVQIDDEAMTLRVIGKSVIAGGEAGKIEIAIRRGNLVRAYLVKYASALRLVTELVIGAKNGQPDGIFQVMVR